MVKFTRFISYEWYLNGLGDIKKNVRRYKFVGIDRIRMKAKNNIEGSERN